MVILPCSLHTSEHDLIHYKENTENKLEMVVCNGPCECLLNSDFLIECSTCHSLHCGMMIVDGKLCSSTHKAEKALPAADGDSKLPSILGNLPGI